MFFKPIWLSAPTPTPTEAELAAEQALDLFKKDPFHYFNMNGLATDPQMQAMAAEIYQLLQVVALAFIALSILWAVIKWGMTPPGKKQEGIVSILGWKLILVAVIACFVEIVSIFLIMFDRMAGSL